MNERRRRVREAFTLAMEALEGERASLLDHLCGSDTILRREVEALLQAAHDAEADSFMSNPTGGAPTDVHAPLAERASPVIGPYTLLHKIGEGGFGVVYVAEQKEPVKRHVALKIIKQGMDTRSIIARFEAERQALAMMDHPNIAKVYDAGATEADRPYFVMELIRGVPVVEYCNAEKLDTRARLELFIPICHAIQHAHQKGIIHRDIKPSNVLVTLHDDKPVPKVIDFGIAKATNAELTEKTLFTHHRQLIGTPAYMSPEQAEMSGLDIDTRSDVYSLGVLLYELLTNTTPFDNRELARAGFAEMMRIIREVEPPKPSTRLSTLGMTTRRSAERPSLGTKRLGAILRGDLDWIAMKCLEKDRSRRYDTASGLAADVQRHLAGEPVVAAPPSIGYRARKFARKHRAFLAMAATIAVLLISGMAGTTWGLVRARRAVVAEQRAKDQAIKRLAQIEKGVDLFAQMLTNIDPNAESYGGDPLYVQLRERAEQAEAELAGEAVGDSLAVARLQTILGTTLRGLGSYQTAITALEKARATRERELGINDPATLDTLNKLAIAYQLAGRLPESIQLHVQVRDARLRVLGPDDPETLATLNNLAMAYRAAGRFQEAIQLFEQASDAQANTLGPNHIDTLATLNNLAGMYHAVGRLPEAIGIYEQVRDAQIGKLGTDHASTFATLNNLAMAYQAIGRVPEAIELFERLHDVCAKKLGPGHPNTLTMLNNLAMAYRDVGKLPEAMDLLEGLRDACERELGPDHPDTLRALNNLALTYQATGRLPEAIQLFERVREASIEKLGAGHPYTLGTQGSLVMAYDAAGQPDKAEALQRQLLPLVKESAGRESRDYGNALAVLGHLLLEQRKGADAEPILRECLVLRGKEFSDGSKEVWRRHNIESMLGESLSLQSRFAEAEPLLLTSYNAMKDDPALPPPDRNNGVDTKRNAMQRIADLYEAWERIDPGTMPTGPRAGDPSLAPHNRDSLTIPFRPRITQSSSREPALDPARSPVIRSGNLEILGL